jgi:hypothetical protein
MDYKAWLSPKKEFLSQMIRIGWQLEDVRFLKKIKKNKKK